MYVPTHLWFKAINTITVLKNLRAYFEDCLNSCFPKLPAKLSQNRYKLCLIQQGKDGEKKVRIRIQKAEVKWNPLYGQEERNWPTYTFGRSRSRDTPLPSNLFAQIASGCPCSRAETAYSHGSPLVINLYLQLLPTEFQSSINHFCSVLIMVSTSHVTSSSYKSVNTHCPNLCLEGLLRHIVMVRKEVKKPALWYWQEK